MELERRAIYNLLRMNKHESKSTLPWQTDNYRLRSTDSLFKELDKLGFSLDARHFLAHAESFDTPEEFCDAFVPEEADVKEADHIFLILFELWRRLLPEKRSLSILCDELDEFIYLYDEEKLESEEALHDALTQLSTLLEENVDEGANPHELFNVVQANTANDIESFLFDFIAEKLDVNDNTYASELLEDFMPFVKDKSWFEFLGARVLAVIEPEKANEIISELMAKKDLDAELALELLQFLAHFGDHNLFLKLSKKVIPLLETEDEFQDLLLTTAKYFRCLDQDKMEQKVISLLEKRSKQDLEGDIKREDPDLKTFLTCLN